VVDAAGKLHGTANLHIVGSSVFPTSGWANPTLTIAALALRTADHIADELAAERVVHLPIARRTERAA
jgi:choline dehydrogenase-like flavoprotein